MAVNQEYTLFASISDTGSAPLSMQACMLELVGIRLGSLVRYLCQHTGPKYRPGFTLVKAVFDENWGHIQSSKGDEVMVTVA